MPFNKERTFNDLMRLISESSQIEDQWKRISTVHDQVSQFLSNIYQHGKIDGLEEYKKELELHQSKNN